MIDEQLMSLIKKNFKSPVKAQAEYDRVMANLKGEAALYSRNKYQRDRSEEYIRLNQDELRFNDLINGTTTWRDAILAIKAKYPKPL